MSSIELLYCFYILIILLLNKQLLLLNLSQCSTEIVVFAGQGEELRDPGVQRARRQRRAVRGGDGDRAQERLLQAAHRDARLLFAVPQHHDGPQSLLHHATDARSKGETGVSDAASKYKIILTQA